MSAPRGGQKIHKKFLLRKWLGKLVAAAGVRIVGVVYLEIPVFAPHFNKEK